MNRETWIWSLLFLCGAGFLTYQQFSTPRGVGQQYVAPVETVGQVNADGKIVPIEPGQTVDPAKTRRVVRYDQVTSDAPKAVWSFSRTAGTWIAALLTLAAFSYLYRDNVFYKLAESIIVGVSAGYWIVLNVWEVLVAKVLVKVAPDVARYAFLPDISPDTKPDYLYIVPVILGGLVFCRLVPRIGWLGRWPLAFVVGMTAGLKLILILNADFIQQIKSTIVPLVVFTVSETDRQINWEQSRQNITLVFSVIASLTYFYFSVEHKGLVGRISRAGVWVLMISFGASFALTVMGRITLLTMRLQFLFDDWLGLVKM